MAQTFNSPPGWPKPPEGWTPPPGWTPDPSWPQAPDGWQFWIEDPFTAAVAAEATAPKAPSQSVPTQPPSGTHPDQPPSGTQPGRQPQSPPPGPVPDPQATQTMGVQPTQAFPTQSAPPGQPGLYAYAPSAGLEQPGASPYGPQGAPQQGGYGGGGYPGGQYTPPGAPTPKPRNATMIIVVAVVALLVVGGLAWGLISLFSGGDEEPTAGGDPTTTEPASPEPSSDEEPTTEEPTDDPTTDDPTTDPTDDPTTPDSGGGSGSFTDLTGTDPALVLGSTGEPVVEVRLVEAVPGWESSQASSLCAAAENGQHLGLNLEFTILPAMANEPEPSYTFIGWELGALVDDTVIETSAFSTGLFCVSSSERAPSEMQPGETYTGWSVLDVPENVTAVTFEDLFDWSGVAPTFRWVLADQ